MSPAPITTAITAPIRGATSGDTVSPARTPTGSPALKSPRTAPGTSPTVMAPSTRPGSSSGMVGASAVPSSPRSVPVANCGSPSKTTRPWSSTMPRSQIWSTRSSEWVTNRIVRPSRWNSAILSRHFFANASSPTASTSSTSRMSGSTCTATAKPSRTYIPEE